MTDKREEIAKIISKLNPYIEDGSRIGRTEAIDQILALLQPEQPLPILNSGHPLLDVPGTGYGFVVQTTEESAINDKWLLTEEEWEAASGDDEELLIAQHNKTVNALYADGWRKVN